MAQRGQPASLAGSNGFVGVCLVAVGSMHALFLIMPGYMVAFCGVQQLDANVASETSRERSERLSATAIPDIEDVTC